MNAAKCVFACWSSHKRWLLIAFNSFAAMCVCVRVYRFINFSFLVKRSHLDKCGEATIWLISPNWLIRLNGIWFLFSLNVSHVAVMEGFCARNGLIVYIGWPSGNKNERSTAILEQKTGKLCTFLIIMWVDFPIQTSVDYRMPFPI